MNRINIKISLVFTGLFFARAFHLTAMQFTNEVDWSLFDFIIIGRTFIWDRPSM